MSEQGSSVNQTSFAVGIFIAALIFLLPIAYHNYLQPHYVYIWYHLKLNMLYPIYWVVTNEVTEAYSGAIFFWVSWFLVGSHLPQEAFSGVVVDAYLDLVSVVDTTSEGLMLEYTNSDYTYNNRFITTGRLVNAIYSPIFVIALLRISYGFYNKQMHDKVYTLDEFIEDSAEGFPELLPVIYRNPLKEPDLDKGPMRMSPKPLDYLKEHGCIEFFVRNEKKMFRLLEEPCFDLVEEQLGCRWEGVSNLSYPERCLIALATPMVVEPVSGVPRTSELVSLLGYAHSSKPGFKESVDCFLKKLFSYKSYILSVNKKGDLKKIFKNQLALISSFFDIFGGLKESKRQRWAMKKSNKIINKILKKDFHESIVQDVVNGHAYTSTVIAALIEKARLGGSLPSCTSPWIKYDDRRLFYIFNVLGRHVSWVETCGFVSHYLYEKKNKIPFPFPKVENGVIGIDQYLKDSFYEYEPIERWVTEED